MSSNILFVVGASHRTAPFEFREKIALSLEQEACLSLDLSGLSGVAEFVILRTCNRVEVYGVAKSLVWLDRVASAVCARQGVNSKDFVRFGYAHEGQGAISHLMNVAVGLDSQILGETEIFGQLKVAYSVALTRHSVGAVLNRVFQKAFQAAKQARSTTAISSGQVSVVNVAVDLALKVFGELSTSRVVLLGAGDIGTKSAKAFTSRGAGKIAIASRRLERARVFAAEINATAFDFELRDAELNDADILVCSTSASGHVVTAGSVRAAMSRRPARPMFIVDLAMPRDVDPSVGDLENVFLYNLDDLALIAEENRLARVAEANRCRTFIAGKAASLWTCISRILDRSDDASNRLQPAIGSVPALA